MCTQTPATGQPQVALRGPPGSSRTVAEGVPV